MDDWLFDPEILTGWDDELTNLLNQSGLKLRPLKRSDFDLGYLQLLSQLTTVGELDKKGFDRKQPPLDCALLTHTLSEIQADEERVQLLLHHGPRR